MYVFMTVVFLHVPFFMAGHSLRKSGAEDVAFWLQYWLIFGLIFVLENFFDGSNFWFYIPKLLFLGWCFHPKYRGAMTIYEAGAAILSFTVAHRSISSHSDMHTTNSAESSNPSTEMDLKVCSYCYSRTVVLVLVQYRPSFYPYLSLEGDCGWSIRPSSHGQRVDRFLLSAEGKGVSLITFA